MPEVAGYEHILQYLFELGLASQSGLGPTPISFTEMRNWALLSQIKLRIFEVEALRRLSSVYIDQAELSKQMNCPPPFVPDFEPTPESRAAVTDFFRNLARKKRKSDD